MLGYIPRKPPYGLATSAIAGSCDPQFQNLLRGYKMLIHATEPRGNITPQASLAGGKRNAVPTVANGTVEMGANEFGPAIRSNFADAGGSASQLKWTIPRMDAARFSDRAWTVAVFAQWDVNTLADRFVEWFKLNNTTFRMFTQTTNPSLQIVFPTGQVQFGLDITSDLPRFAAGATIVWTFRHPRLSCWLDNRFLGEQDILGVPAWGTGAFTLNDNAVNQKGQWRGWMSLVLVSARVWGEGERQLFTNNPFGVLWPAVGLRLPPIIPEVVGFVQGIAEVRAAVFASSRADSAVSGKADARPAVFGTGAVSSAVSGKADARPAVFGTGKAGS